MMTCEEIAELLGDFMDGRVPFSTAMSMRMHLMMCKHCKRYYQQTRQVVLLTQEHVVLLEPQSLGEARASEPAHEELLEAFREQHAG